MSYERAKQEMRLTERIVAFIPGFRGYKEKELRRESDRVIRNHLYAKLDKAKKDTRDAYQKLADRRSFEVLNDMDRLVAKFDRIAEKVNHASYGYKGFFDVIKVEEKELDQMIDFDNQLIDDVDRIADQAANMKAQAAKMKFDEAKQSIQDLTDTVESFETMFDKRDEVILGVA